MLFTYPVRIGLTCALLIATFQAVGCGAGDTFPCGEGTCDLATEVCLSDGGGCNVCAPRPAACDSKVTCGCLPPANDASWGDRKCDDAGTCAESEGGLVLTCSIPQWGCG